MFTGIIKEVGEVIRIESSAGLYRLVVASKALPGRVSTGDSVSVNGACLTLVGKENDTLRFDVMEETVRRTGLSSLKGGDRVNLEDSLRVGDALGGHFVLGHIDCAGSIKNVRESGGEFVMEIGLSEGSSAPLVVEKGSVAVDGVSLTVGETKADSFNVYLIPYTIKSTTLGLKRKGDRVNIEFDIIGKYIKRFEAEKGPSRITESFLKEKGF